MSERSERGEPGGAGDVAVPTLSLPDLDVPRPMPEPVASDPPPSLAPLSIEASPGQRSREPTPPPLGFDSVGESLELEVARPDLPLEAEVANLPTEFAPGTDFHEASRLGSTGTLGLRLRPDAEPVVRPAPPGLAERLFSPLSALQHLKLAKMGCFLFVLLTPVIWLAFPSAPGGRWPTVCLLVTIYGLAGWRARRHDGSLDRRRDEGPAGQ